MRTRQRLAGGVLALTTCLVLAGCGESGSSNNGSDPGVAAPAPSAASSGGTSTEPSAATAGGTEDCKPVAGKELIVLTDDKKLQTVDNIVPAINTKAVTPALTAALDKVSATLTTADLVTLNQQVGLQRKTSPNVAKAYVKDKGLADGLSGGSGSITVGAANFPENQTVAEIYAAVLDASGFTAKVQTIGNREVYLPALEKGQIQVVPEYVGTLTEFLNKDQNGKDAKAVASPDLDATVTGLTPLAKTAGLTIGKPAEAADQNAFAVTKEFADAIGVKTLSELGAKCGSGLVLGGPAECPTRPFCQPGLEQSYGLTFDSFTALDAGGPLTQTAIKTGKVSIGLVFSSDAGLSPTS